MAPTLVNVNFPIKDAKILGIGTQLDYSKPDYSILKKLGLQGVSDEDKQKIMRAFYITPPQSTNTLDLQAYPEIQEIIKPLLIDLIHKQQPDIIIQKVAAVRDSSIPIHYGKKRNHGVSLSIQLPSYLVNDKTARIIETTSIQKGINNSKVTVNSAD